MRARSTPARLAVAATLVAGLAAPAACGADEGPPPPARRDGVAVASFNFPESRLVAEIYAQALADDGVAVRRELDLGPRELVAPALRQGAVDVVPEYLGSALTATAPAAAQAIDPTDPDAVAGALARALAPQDLRVLRPAPAQNQNGLVVTRATADDRGLAAISDLAAAPPLRLGGPPECPERPYCLPGLRATYGLDVAAFVPLDGQARVERALRDGVVDVGVLFTTDGALAGDDLVLLTDDRGLQPAENLVPVVRAEVVEGAEGERVVAALDAVSARLTTDSLRFLNWRVTVAGNEPAAEARGWLIRQGLVAR